MCIYMCMCVYTKPYCRHHTTHPWRSGDLMRMNTFPKPHGSIPKKCHSATAVHTSVSALSSHVSLGVDFLFNV